VITLGGTHQQNDWNLKIDKKDSQDIWENTLAFVPALKVIHAFAFECIVHYD
jgi:hypothetical protein